MTTLAGNIFTFAEIAGNIDSKVFSDLAGHGDKGIIVALIIALIVLSAAYAGLCAPKCNLSSLGLSGSLLSPQCLEPRTF